MCNKVCYLVVFPRRLLTDSGLSGVCRSHSSYRAEYIVKNVTGTRFALLNSVEPTYHSMDAVKAWETTLHEHVEQKLDNQKLGAGHPLFEEMVKAGTQGLGYRKLRSLSVTQSQCDALVKDHVLAAHADGTYTCAARHVVKSFQQLRMAQTAPSATTGASAAAPGGSAR